MGKQTPYQLGYAGANQFACARRYMKAISGLLSGAVRQRSHGAIALLLALFLDDIRHELQCNDDSGSRH